MAYEYDSLLRGHLKMSFWGTLGRMGMGAAKGALQFGKGVIGMGAGQGAGLAARGANLAGKATGIAAPVAGMMMAGNNKPGLMNPLTQNKMGSIIHPVVDLAGLGILGMRPYHHMMHSTDPEEKRDAKFELAGLGTLAAPSALEVGSAGVQKLKKLLHR
jgi:hypothetical protein